MKQNELLSIVISIFLLVLVYIGFSIYHNSITSTIPDALSIQIQPIASSFDTKTLDAVKKRTQVAVDLDASPILPVTPTPTPTKPSLSPAPTATPKPTQPVPTISVATQSANTP